MVYNTSTIIYSIDDNTFEFKSADSNGSVDKESTNDNNSELEFDLSLSAIVSKSNSEIDSV